MRIIRISETPKEEALREAVSVLREGGVVAFPTETFYGLGVRYDEDGALAKLYELKGRPKVKAMPLIVGGGDVLRLVAKEPGVLARKLMARFWPGPLSLLMRAVPGLPDFLTAGTGKVAVRIPGESFALDLSRAAGFPLTATSANISGMPPASTAGDIIRYFGEQPDLIIDGGRTAGGKPSTIVDVSGENMMIVRHGVIPDEEIIQACKP